MAVSVAVSTCSTDGSKVDSASVANDSVSLEFADAVGSGSISYSDAVSIVSTAFSSSYSFTPSIVSS